MGPSRSQSFMEQDVAACENPSDVVDNMELGSSPTCPEAMLVKDEPV